VIHACEVNDAFICGAADNVGAVPFAAPDMAPVNAASDGPDAPVRGAGVRLLRFHPWVMDTVPRMLFSSASVVGRPRIGSGATPVVSAVSYVVTTVPALVYALREASAILQSAVVAGKLRGSDSYRIGGVYLQTITDALDSADAALDAARDAT